LAETTQISSRHDNSVTGDPDLNRRILTLVGGFRLLVSGTLLLLVLLPAENSFLGLRYPLLFAISAATYSLGALAIAVLLRNPDSEPRFISKLQLTLDITCIGLIVHASGGVGSGIEALLVVFVTAGGMTLPARGGYFAAAVATIVILVAQSLSFLAGLSAAANFIQAGVIGAIMMAILMALQPLLKRVSESETLARQRGIDLKNLAQLNEYIIQTLREAIMVIDEHDHVRLINQAAIETLGTDKLRAGMPLQDASDEVFSLLSNWRADKLDLSREIPQFSSADGTSLINVHFAPLGNDNGREAVLIFLEDASLLAEKVQQSKLAALGRLSASIAHEIRNPVGALSHAAQLLRESASIGEQDQRFIEIIQTNSKRVSEIVDNILQLSRKDTVKPEIMQLNEWTPGFVREFESTLELFEGQLSIATRDDVEVRMDPGHLHQIVWNLCENAMKYASETAGAIAVEIHFGRLPNSGRPFLEIADHGPGVPEDMQDSVFEPFATGRTGGTGLGLYICRELCERNRATLRYRPRESGGSVFQLVFSDPTRWDTRA
jgi:two-component system sensor histidine kinase PilS (NtrC family)